MSNNINNPTIYGEPGNWNVPLTKLPSQAYVGQRITVHNPTGAAPGVGPIGVSGASKSFQMVQLDSGVGQAATIGDIVFWRNKNNYTVTVSQTESLGQNHPAGIILESVTLGNATFIQFKGPAYVKVRAADQAATVNGDYLIPSAATWGQATRVAAGTAPTNTVVGIASAPTEANGLVLADLNLPETT